jgi:hypothetical protein
MTSPTYTIIPPFRGTVIVAIPGEQPTLLRVTGVDWNDRENVLRVAVATPEFSTEHAPGLGQVEPPSGAASLRHESSDPRGEPLYAKGQGDYEVRKYA